METKSNTKLTLIGKSPPIFTTEGSQEFTGSFPPTGEQILLQLYAYHKYLQEATGTRSSFKDASRFIIKDIEIWWEPTGITIMTWQHLQKKTQY